MPDVLILLVTTVAPRTTINMHRLMRQMALKGIRWSSYWEAGCKPFGTTAAPTTNLRTSWFKAFDLLWYCSICQNTYFSPLHTRALNWKKVDTNKLSQAFSRIRQCTVVSQHKLTRQAQQLTIASMLLLQGSWVVLTWCNAASRVWNNMRTENNSNSFQMHTSSECTPITNTNITILTLWKQFCKGPLNISRV